MRQHMEPLLYRYGADLILSGHVHAYERHHPTYKGERNLCGPVYLNLGDGGNREGAYIPWQQPQPAYSAFREGSFGIGSLRLVNATHALYNWTRSACEGTGLPEHVNFAPGCVSNSSHGSMPDNAEHPSVESEQVWIVRQAMRLSNPVCLPEDTPGAPLVLLGDGEGPGVGSVEEEQSRLEEDACTEQGGGLDLAPGGQLAVAALCGAIVGAALLLLAQHVARSQRCAAHLPPAVPHERQAAGCHQGPAGSTRTPCSREGRVWHARSSSAQGAHAGRLASPCPPLQPRRPPFEMPRQGAAHPPPSLARPPLFYCRSHRLPRPLSQQPLVSRRRVQG